ncbi:transcription repressor OFP3-like [Lolium rigidum]|uniref:transcription repressor OFP3-like n=1 Tax=Lolium rigidum TaxID=89674 RepID=UPI001F5D5CB8|nr:transcription repressor OFP3-like [Lolium rigidum]
MDHGGGGGRSSSRLRDRLARMFRPSSLLRSTCNNNTASTSSSSSSAAASSAADGVTASKPAPSSACSSSRALLAADSAVARDRDSFLTSSRRDYAVLVGRTESFSNALDRVHRRAGSVGAAQPLVPSRFSMHASPLMESKKNDKEKSPLYCHPRHRHRLGGSTKSDKSKKLLSSNPYGFSSSNDDDADTDGDEVFSSDADERGRGGAKKGEAEAFFSSSRSFSFSSDSSEFYTNKKKPTKKSPTAVAPKPPAVAAGTRRQRRKHRRAASSCDTCGVKEGFRPVVSAAEEQVRRGFAVVQRSRDPYADFRASMVEMVVSRQMFGAAELERLLRSYLSLNAPRHHPVILQAFSDIWVVLHGG